MGRLYIVVTDATGSVTAQRYVEDGERLREWLTLTDSHRDVRCDAYDDAPSLGGRRLRSLFREGGRWAAGQ